MSNKYTLLVEADLDQKGSFDTIQKSLGDLGTKLELEIKKVKVSLDQGAKEALRSQIEKAIGVIKVEATANVTEVTKGAGGAAAGKGKPTGTGESVSPGNVYSQEAARARIAEIQSGALGKFSGVKIKEELQGITSATIKYTNAMDYAVVETFKLAKGTDQLEWTMSTYSDNQEKRFNQEQQRIKQETQGIKAIAEAQKRLEEVRSNVARAASVGQNTAAGGMIDTSKMVELQGAARQYETIINQIQAKGNIIGPDDNQRLQVARVELDKINKELSDMVSRSELVSDKLAEAQKSIDRAKSAVVGKSGMNQQVKDTVAAQDELAVSRGKVEAAAKSGLKVSDQELEALNKQVIATNNATNALIGQGKSANGWSKEMGVAIKRSIEWAGAMTLLYGSLRQVQQGIQFIRDLNKELTNVQIVTGTSSQGAEQLSLQYNKLAKQLGATTIEVAKGSLEWARQGKSAEESSVLITNSMMMSKLAAMDSADATSRLTSIMNGFQLKASDMVGVLDELVALDNAYATSVGK